MFVAERGMGDCPGVCACLCGCLCACVCVPARTYVLRVSSRAGPYMCGYTRATLCSTCVCAARACTFVCLHVCARVHPCAVRVHAPHTCALRVCVHVCTRVCQCVRVCPRMSVQQMLVWQHPLWVRAEVVCLSREAETRVPGRGPLTWVDPQAV